MSVSDIDWDRCTFLWNYGVRRFYCKHDMIAPEQNIVPLVEKN